MSHSHKPLPAVPLDSTDSSSTGNHLGRLTIEGRAHLRQFIKHALAEGSDEVSEEWVAPIEIALSDLGESLARGCWLAGLKTKRTAANTKRREGEREQRRMQMQKLAEEKEAKEGKNKSKVKEKEKDKGKDRMDSGESTLQAQAAEGSKLANKSPEEIQKMALEQLQRIAKSSNTPASISSSKHLLLTLSAEGAVLPRHDMDFDIVPSSKACVFLSGSYALPSGSSWTWMHGPESTVLYGLEEWDVEALASDDDPIRLVGGTFIFNGASSAVELQTLSKVLRLSIFVYLSLLLEQSLLADSHVELRFPTVSAKPIVFSRSSPPMTPIKELKRHSSQRSSPTGGIWSFLSKKTGNLLHRATHVAQGPLSEFKRSGSLDLVRVSSALSTPRTSADHTRLNQYSRRLSFSFSPSPSRPARDDTIKPIKQAEREPLFDDVLSRVSDSASVLSTSAGMTFPAPQLIVKLAEKEKQDPRRKLSAEEKVGLTSVLGWEGRDLHGRNMSGLAGFVRHQGINTLYAEYVRAPNPPPSPAPSTASSSATSIVDDTVSPLQTDQIACMAGRWLTYRYYSRTRQDGLKVTNGDSILGDVIEELCERAEEVCVQPDCELKRCDHQHVWMHDGIRINLGFSKLLPPEGATQRPDTILMWESCGICHKTTSPRDVSDGTYLLSFGKFLELLIHSPALSALSPTLCEHTIPPRARWPSGDSPLRPRLNIVRHFRYRLQTVDFGLSEVTEIFELRLPRLQLSRAMDIEANGTDVVQPTGSKKAADVSDRDGRDADDTRKALRKEIRLWWQGLSDHMEKLEECYCPEDTPHPRKSLPRLPSTDDDYLGEDAEGNSDDINATPKARLLDLPPLPPSRTSSPVRNLSPSSSLLRTDSDMSSRTATLNYPVRLSEQSSVLSHSSSNGSTVEKQNNMKDESNADLSFLLSNLRYNFQQTEQSLYTQLSCTPNSNLNDVRRSFIAVARGAAMRLSAWQKKHTNVNAGAVRIGQLEVEEPEWWTRGCHAVPGGKVVVREAEWGSIISFTLTSLDYQREMKRTSLSKGDRTNGHKKSDASPSESTSTTSTILATTIGALFSPNNNGFRPFSATAPLPDPDSDDHIWHTAEGCSTAITRQEHLKDPSALLSLRDVLRTRRSFDIPGSAFLNPSRFTPSKFIGATARSVSSGTPPSAWAKAAVEVNMQEVSGLPSVGGESAERILMEMDSAAEAASTGSSLSSSVSSSGFAEAAMCRGKASSIISLESNVEGGPDALESALALIDTSSTESHDSLPPETETTSRQLPADRRSVSSVEFPLNAPVKSPKESTMDDISRESSAGDPAASYPETPTPSTITATFTSTLSQAMRYIMNPADSIRPTSPAHHHKLLALDSASIDKHPHIKYDWTIGKRLKFSCTVYFAKEFEVFRKRCGVDDVMAKSLERSEIWAAKGGKSRSNFWKSSDDRFIIKTLVNAWNVADLQVLLDIAPSYFRYMESTANKPSVITKLLGFYTIEIKNLETATVQAKADLLVMENLFYDQTIIKTFDLKGIQGRKVKASDNVSSNRIRFDGEWIEGQRTVLTLVKPHSKAVLTEAIKADAEFLCKSNIMDYSLLLGVDQERRQIACGLVDTIGSYTFAKTLEYKAKQNLKSGKEVTVIPPTEYQERFVTAMNNYFLACPDKWTRPLHDSPSMYSDMRLPSVL